MPGRKAEVQVLVEYLQDCYRERKVATYEEMRSLLFGVDVKRKHRNWLSSALAAVMRENNYQFQTLHNVGYQPLYEDSVLKMISAKRIGKHRSNARIYREEVDTAVRSGKVLPRIDLKIAELQCEALHRVAADETLTAIREVAHRNPVNVGVDDLREVGLRMLNIPS